MQEDKELVFDAMDTTKGCLTLFTGMLATMRFRKDRMADSAKHGFTNATDAADYLVNHGVPFRDAHGTWDSWCCTVSRRGRHWMI